MTERQSSPQERDETPPPTQAAFTGIAIGLAGALTLQRVIASQLHGVSPTDPVVFATVAGFVGIVSLGAAALPAWWAMKVQPLVALRHE